MSGEMHPGTQLGMVSLKVRDIGRSIDYYAGELGLMVLDSFDGTGHLGSEDRLLIELVERPQASPKGRTAGLYHFALLLESRPALGRLLRRLIQQGTPVIGASDHGVSEAIYLQDPDDNGIEIYRDRPRPEWPTTDGELDMVTAPLDVDSILAESAPTSQEPPADHLTARVGHIHLHVSNLSEAEAFYADALGFKRQQRYGRSALFFGAGGYHHHVGVNTWAGEGAPPAPEGAVGLQLFSIELPEKEELTTSLSRLESAGVSFQPHRGGYLLHDPSNNAILLGVEGEIPNP
jgi:catechol 2,3-dioxygenase